MTIYLPKSVLIQPRTSLGKSDVSWRWILSGSSVHSGNCTCTASFRCGKRRGVRQVRILQNQQTFWRARSRLYQNEILQENMRLTAFFNLYKICILLHRFCTERNCWNSETISSKLMDCGPELQKSKKRLRMTLQACENV